MSSDRGGGGCALIVFGALALAYCSPSKETRTTSFEDESSSAALEDYQDKAEEADSSVYGDEEKGDETRAEYEERQDEIAGDRGTYYGDVCTVNCGGHDAGREWAEEHGITNPDDCGGGSWSFQEGCETYAREQQVFEDEEEVEE